MGGGSGRRKQMRMLRALENMCLLIDCLINHALCTNIKNIFGIDQQKSTLEKGAGEKKIVKLRKWILRFFTMNKFPAVQ